jgi:ribonuclease T2
MIRSARALGFLFALGLLAASEAGAGPKPRPVAPEAGIFDAYVLGMSYENDFCVSHPDKKECKNGHAASFGMALHGLWPNRDNDPRHTYQYCGNVTERQLGKNWCAPKYDVRRDMTERTFAALADVMPGVESCLYNHEWYAHGTCSGVSPEEYFDQSQELAKKFIALPRFNGLLKSRAGQAVSYAELLGALSADLGADAASSMLINCRRAGKVPVSYLSEVLVTLDRRRFMEFPAPTSLGKNALPVGNCPAEGIQISR